MNEEIKVDLSGKVVLSLEEFLKINNQIIELKKDKEDRNDKYDQLVDYLLNRCELAHYTSGEYGLTMSSWRCNNITDWLEEHELVQYTKRVNQLKKNEEE